jgi:hypothetical protein
MKTNKGQLKIQEMSFMLLALVLFVIIAGLFYISISAGGLKKEYARISQEETITLIARVADNPELSCGKSLCIDTDKLMVLKNRPAYQGFWDIESLKIRKIFPYSTEDIECNPGNYNTCNIFTIKSSNVDQIYDKSYVVLCRKESEERISYDKCELGMIIGGTKRE